MDVVRPTSWAEARLDTATPRDRAPLLAIACAIRERWDALGPDNWIDSMLTDAVEPAVSALQRMDRPEWGYDASLVVTAICELRKRFLNLHVDYSGFGYSRGWPDRLEQRCNPATMRTTQHDGIFPQDLFALHPCVPHSSSGDSTNAAITRAFYAWARACLDEMVYVVAARSWAQSFVSSGIWSSAAEMAAAAILDGGGSGLGSVTASCSAEYDAANDIYWSQLSIPKTFSVCNLSAIPADAVLVARALDWPSGQWSTTSHEASRTFDTFGASDLSGPGPSSTSVRVAAGAWASLWDLASCPTPSSPSPPAPGADIPSASGMHDFTHACELGAYFDFSQTYAFRPDPSEEESTT